MTRGRWILLLLTRQDDLVIWRRPTDRWVSVCCYKELARLVGPMRKGQTVRAAFQIRRVTTRHDGP